MHFFDLGAGVLFVIEVLHADMVGNDRRAGLNNK